MLGRMNELSTYYKELSILQLKYEHLVETSRTLLKPWPTTKHNAAAKEEDKSSASASDTAEASSNPDFQSAELEQIDALLDKAQRMRVCSSSAEQRKKLSKQSLNLASSVYKPSGKADKVTVSLTRLTRLKPDAGQITAAKCMRHSKSRHSKLPKPSSEPAIGSKSGARPLKSLSKPASIASGINTKEKAQKAHNMESEPEFSLQTNGAQISLPPEYTKLRRTVSRCEEALNEDLAAKAAATHFSKRLLSKQNEACTDRIHLLLIAEEMEFLKAMLMSMTPYEWTVSNRSTWEDVLSVKTKIDLLMECYYKVISKYDRRDAHHSPSRLGVGKRESFVMLGHEEASERSEFSYSSVKDWDALVAAEVQRGFKKWEEKYLTEIHQTLMPATSQYIGGSSGKCEVDTSTLASVLRVVGVASNMSTKPIYLDTGSHH